MFMVLGLKSEKCLSALSLPHSPVVCPNVVPQAVLPPPDIYSTQYFSFRFSSLFLLFNVSVSFRAAMFRRARVSIYFDTTNTV